VERTLAREGLTGAAVATTAREAMTAVGQHRPDLVLVATGLPDRDGLDLGRDLVERHPGTRLVAMTGSSDPSLVDAAVRAGFHGFVAKDVPAAHFVRVIRSVLDGEVVFPPRRRATTAPRRGDPFAELTSRELEVLSLLAEGLRTDAVAERLSVSGHTVRSHVQNILTKLGLHSRLEAATFAARHGLAPRARTSLSA